MSSSKGSNKRRLYSLETNELRQEASSETSERILKAKKLIHKSALSAAPNGLIPLPVLNYGALAYVQARLIQRIGKMYDQKTSLKDIRKIVGILISCYITEFLSNNTLIQGLRVIPGIPTFVGLGLSTAFYYSSTKIIGEIFLQHFESGETILTFDPELVKRYYARSLQQDMKSNSG